MSRQLIFGRIAPAALAIVAALSIAGCSSTISGNAQPAVDGTIDAVSATNAPRTSSAKPSSPPSGTPPPTTSSKGGDTDFNAEIGDCVTLGGTTEDATIEKASCGSRTANYKVIGKAATSSQCVSDRDSAYYETLNGIQTGAICLDIDWVVGGCMDFPGNEPQRIDCSAAAVKGVKVVSIEKNADDASVCSTNSGYEYPARRFVVCVSDI